MPDVPDKTRELLSLLEAKLSLLEAKFGPIHMEYKLVHPDAKLPFRKRTTDAGYDLSSVEDKTIEPHSTENISTGIKIACPPGTYYTIEGRSSLWSLGIAPYRGIIDAGYNGDLMVTIMNISNKAYHISKGDRIAQILPHRQLDIDFTEVEKFSPDYDIRGESGFGSSGK